MPTDYDKLYQQQRHTLGDPSTEFVVFFDQFANQNADALDLGCGQGRDALFIARHGHHVVGVDISQTGIAQLLEDAQAEGLNIEGIVADLREYEPSDEYDVVVADRSLHMLDSDVRLEVLKRVCRSIRDGGFILIADEKSNLPNMRTFFEIDAAHWIILKDAKGTLFAQKAHRTTHDDARVHP